MRRSALQGRIHRIQSVIYVEKMIKIPFTYLRGGTSRGIFFHKKDLPEDQNLWNEIFLKTIGVSCHGKELSVMGTDLPTKKIAVISPLESSSADVEYHFFQIDPEHGRIDNRGTCGNMASAVGPFVIDEGMVKATEPETAVRIYNLNTKRVITSRVKVKDGLSLISGDERIPGVPGTGSPVQLDFERPGGGFSGALFPTGNRTDIISLPQHGDLSATIIDCVNPIIILRAEDIGLLGREIRELDRMPKILDKIETARGIAAQILCLVRNWEDAKLTSTYIPHVVLVSLPQSYTSLEGCSIASDKMDICCRAVFTKLHKTFPVGAAVGTAAAAALRGTVASDCFRGLSREQISIGHPAGVLQVGIEIDNDEVIRGTVVRTARRLFDGVLYFIQE